MRITTPLVRIAVECGLLRSLARKMAETFSHIRIDFLMACSTIYHMRAEWSAPSRASREQENDHGID